MTQEKQREETLQVIAKTIANCEKMQPKFAPGTAQHTLLHNRIKALYIAQAVVSQVGIGAFTTEEIQQAIVPIASIIHKTTKAQSKYEVDTKQYKRFVPLIAAMTMAQTEIEGYIQA